MKVRSFVNSLRQNGPNGRSTGLITESPSLPFAPQLRPPPLSPLVMSSIATSPSKFQSIFDAALSDYAKQTGIDLTTCAFAQTLQNCDSADHILDLLQDKAKQFQAYRDGNRKLIDCLKPVVQVLHIVSGILGEAAIVSPLNRLVLPDRILTVLFPGAIPTFKSNNHWRRCTPHSAYSPCLRRILLCNICVFQASIGISASYGALVDVFECVANFLNRLRIYTGIPFSPSMSDIVTKILVEVLSVLALATKQIKQGRLSKQFHILCIIYF